MLCVLFNGIFFTFAKSNSMRTVLITGGAGFIGSNLADKMLNKGFRVIAIDSFDDYYDLSVKKRNIAQALKHPAYFFIENDINHPDGYISEIPANTECIFHLAARAGVRHSIQHPEGYQKANVDGTISIARVAEHLQIPKIVFTSSSSVYGNNPTRPWLEDSATNPMNPYASTKLKAEEFLSDFSSQTGIEIVIMRLFSVYGRRMRPDLMMDKIFNCICSGKELTVYGDGSSERDYTYIDDIINGLLLGMDYKGECYEVFNLGNNYPVQLSRIIHSFEKLMNQNAKINYLPAIGGESVSTCAGITKAVDLLAYNPSVNIETGIRLFIEWKHNN